MGLISSTQGTLTYLLAWKLWKIRPTPNTAASSPVDTRIVSLPQASVFVSPNSNILQSSPHHPIKTSPMKLEVTELKPTCLCSQRGRSSLKEMSPPNFLLFLNIFLHLHLQVLEVVLHHLLGKFSDESLPHTLSGFLWALQPKLRQDESFSNPPIPCSWFRSKLITTHKKK